MFILLFLSVVRTYYCKFSVNYLERKPVMCQYCSKFGISSDIKEIGVECFPCECEIIIYEDFCISNKSVITVESGMIKLISKNK